MISRSKIANLENHEKSARTNVTLPELFVLATALGVPPAALLFPTPMGATVEVLPDVELSTLDAVAWTAAADPTMPEAMPRAPGDDEYHNETAGEFLVARMQAEKIGEIDAARDRYPDRHREAVGELEEFLTQFRAIGYRLPPLPPRIAAELAAGGPATTSRHLIPRTHRQPSGRAATPKETT